MSGLIFTFYRSLCLKKYIYRVLLYHLLSKNEYISMGLIETVNPFCTETPSYNNVKLACFIWSLNSSGNNSSTLICNKIEKHWITEIAIFLQLFLQNVYLIFLSTNIPCRHWFCKSSPLACSSHWNLVYEEWERRCCQAPLGNLYVPSF